METHTHIREVVQKNLQFKTFAFGECTPLPTIALFQAVFMPYFFFVIETEVFLSNCGKLLSSIYHAILQKIATVVKQQQHHSILGQHLYQGHPNFFLIYDRMKQNSSRMTKHRYTSTLIKMSQYASRPMRDSNTSKGFLNTRQRVGMVWLNENVPQRSLGVFAPVCRKKIHM